MDRKLNKRQLAYCYWRARGSTQEQGIRKAGYTAKGKVVRALGARLETNENIKSQIETEKANIFDKNMITEEYILEGIKKIAETGKLEANKLRAWELLAKTKAMLTDKVEQTKSDDPDNQFSLERLGRMKN